VSVPLTLLGLLERGPSHGYDLKRDYDAYFGQGRPLRYSQVYATLSRLARDGKAVAGPVEQGAGPEQRRYVITDEGVADVEKWLAEPAPPEPDLQSELFAKVVLALMLGKLVPELTAEENVALPLLLSGLRRGPAMAAARTWFPTLGLDGLESRRSGELSGGQAQRVALARGLVAAYADREVVVRDGTVGTLTGARP
jgi:DNA-binding PadR family transcriptional regulator